jgi:ATP synthase in type III secretion protein N
MTPSDLTFAHEAQVRQALDALILFQTQSSVSRVTGLIIETEMPECQLGQLCRLETPGRSHEILAEVVGFTEGAVQLAALEDCTGLSTKTRITPYRQQHTLIVGDCLLGCVLDGYGRDYQSRRFIIPPDESGTSQVNVLSNQQSALDRPPIKEVVPTGVRAIDAALTMGKGQRLGIFAPAGCGKTTLLASLARQMQADVIVLALIGERGRELNEFLERELSASYRSKCVVVCATSDKTSMERARAAHTASAIAQAFCDAGKDVVLMVDSLTRFARAFRELGLAKGESPARSGFPPSVFAELPKLIERAGMSKSGSITALYTVLMEDGDGQSDVIAEEARSLLDGHIVLSRTLSERGHFPAIDVVQSLSRVMTHVVDPSHAKQAANIRKWLALLNEVELLVRLNEYEKGSDVEVDLALSKKQEIIDFLVQDSKTPSDWTATQAALEKISMGV